MDLFNYYCVDWVATVLTLSGLYQIGNHKRIGFAIMVVANIFWLIFSILAHSPATSIANIIVGGMNVRGYIKWRRDERVEKERL